MKKGIWILAALLALSLFGCGQKQTEVLPETTVLETAVPAETVQQTVETEPSVPEETEPAEPEFQWTRQMDVSGPEWEKLELDHDDMVLDLFCRGFYDVDMGDMLHVDGNQNWRLRDYISDVEYYVNGERIVIRYQVKNKFDGNISHWELHGEHSQEFRNISGVDTEELDAMTRESIPIAEYERLFNEAANAYFDTIEMVEGETFSVDSDDLGIPYRYGTEDAFYKAMRMEEFSCWNCCMEESGGNWYMISTPESADGLRKPCDHDTLEWAYSYWCPDGSTVRLAYGEHLGNVYSVTTTDEESWGYDIVNFKYEYDVVTPKFYQVTSSARVLPPREPVFGRFKLVTGDTAHFYSYRSGMTLVEWANSELNTDGWFPSADDPFKIISPDGKYCAYTVEPSENGGYFFKWNLRIYEKAWENEVPVTELHPGEYLPNSLYCFNSHSPLRIRGIYTASAAFPGRNPIAYDWAGVHQDFVNNIGQYKGVNDNINFRMDLDYADLIPHMQSFIAPHSENTTVLPDGATEYSILASTASHKYHGGMEANPIAIVTYRPQDDPNFNNEIGMDLFVTYDGEVVYKIHLTNFLETK